MRAKDWSDALGITEPPNQLEVAMQVLRFTPLTDPLGEAARSKVGAELFVMDDSAQGQQQLTVSAVSEAAPAQDSGLTQGSSALMNHHRRTDGKRLENHIAEGFGKERGDYNGPGTSEKPG